MENRTNVGYTITDSIHIGENEFVLGVNDRAPSRFVTWQCTGENNYFWGHYYSDLMEAKRDLLDRAGQELEFQMRRRTQSKAIPEKQDKGRER